MPHVTSGRAGSTHTTAQGQTLTRTCSASDAQVTSDLTTHEFGGETKEKKRREMKEREIKEKKNYNGDSCSYG